MSDSVILYVFLFFSLSGPVCLGGCFPVPVSVFVVCMSESVCVFASHTHCACVSGRVFDCTKCPPLSFCMSESVGLHVFYLSHYLCLCLWAVLR